jgi:gamma-glutamyltranspeptidase / glutathione hydrolase
MPGISQSNDEGRQHTPPWRVWLGTCTLLLAACSTPPAAPEQDLPRQPEAGTGMRMVEAAAVPFARQAVATAHPLASDAGLQVLRVGGNALDAAIAAQLVLALVEPQSSGLGGGAFLLHWDGGALHAWDGRETAPAAADENLFMGADWQPMPFEAAVTGGRAVGVPGAIRMLEAAHREHGRLPWARLFSPAISLAEQGFTVSHRLAGLLRSPDAAALKADPQARAYFFHPGGEPLARGERLRNPAMADLLRQLAARGSVALHEGPAAEDIVRRVRGHAANPGRLGPADLAGYQPQRREPLCTRWRLRYSVCGFPPPSSGHLTTMQLLGLLDHQRKPPAPLEAGLPSVAFLHRYAEAARLAYADRAQYIADPAFVPGPPGGWRSLLDDAYLERRARPLNDERSLGTALPGDPGQGSGLQARFAPQPEQPERGTSHLSIVDADGRAVALTTTIEAAFGSRVMSDGGTGLPGGFLLNNQLTDFAFAPRDAQGRQVANRVQPGKRPRSSMAPTMVFEAHPPRRLLMVLGSAGGAGIIHHNAKVLLGTLGWGLTPQQAADLPNFANDNGPTRLEAGRFGARTQQALQARGHQVVEQALTSGSNVLMWSEGRHDGRSEGRSDGGGWLGGTDPRRDGAVRGD